jgi:hypothetical protein
LVSLGLLNLLKKIFIKIDNFDFLTDGSVLTTKNSNNSQGNTNNTASQNYLILSSRPTTPLPPYVTVAQLLCFLDDSGFSLSEPCLYLTLRQRNKDSKGINNIFLYYI